MTAELVRGQNHPLPGNRLEIRVSAGTPVVAAVTLGDEQGRVGEAGWLAHPGAPNLAGIELPRQAAAEHRLAVDLGAMPPEAHRVHVLLALPGAAGRPGAPADFGAAPAPHLAVTTTDGTAIAGFTITGLGAETALLAVELYRRQGSWKVRAVGQGYQGGLPALLLDQGVPSPERVAAEIHAAADRELARTVTPPVIHRPALPDAGMRPPPPAPSDGSGPVPSTRPDGPGAAAAVPQPASAPSARPGAAPSARPGTPDAETASRGTDPASGATAGSGSGPVDYRHPRRRGAAAPAGAGGQAAPAPAGPPPAQGPAEDRPPVPVAGDAAGWSMEERLYNQVWGMFEDLTRSVAAYRSAVDFAESRLDQELDRLLADPRTRGGPAADAAREQAEYRQIELVDQARAVLERDLAQLAAESEVVEPALPAPFAGWENPVWHGYRVPDKPPLAVRLGSLSLPEVPEIRIPLLVRMPLERGLWIDSAEDRGPAMDTAVAIAARLLASFPVGGFAVHALDPAGSGATALAPLAAAGGVLAEGGRGKVGEVLTRLTERVDLLHMAHRGGVPDALPPGFDTAEQLLIVNEFPYGFDDRAVTQLRYLADEGPAAGVHLLLVADREDASAYGPVLDPLWRSLLRLTPLPSDHLADPWVGHAWTYEPSMVPAGSQVLTQVLRQVAAARPAFGT
jgi:hypothetical protein